jgi:serine/threonine protein kinase
VELSPPDPRVGQVLQGRYRILERLAAGAMGVVYRGERVELARPVAVKFLHPWIAAQPAFRARFETEARAMSRLNHPNCVSVIDFGVEGSPYLIMDFVTGGTLRKVLEWGRLAPARAVAIARQLLAGVAHAHAQGIVHRDLKPDNMILTDTDGLPDHIKILDFGLAKLRDGPAMTSGLAIGRRVTCRRSRRAPQASSMGARISTPWVSYFTRCSRARSRSPRRRSPTSW